MNLRNAFTRAMECYIIQSLDNDSGGSDELVKISKMPDNNSQWFHLSI
jgi:hypothetical protein